jgi:hypothetical protein
MSAEPRRDGTVQYCMHTNITGQTNVDAICLIDELPPDVPKNTSIRTIEGAMRLWHANVEFQLGVGIDLREREDAV